MILGKYIKSFAGATNILNDEYPKLHHKAYANVRIKVSRQLWSRTGIMLGEVIHTLKELMERQIG